jgi:hypothetical protein
MSETKFHIHTEQFYIFSKLLIGSNLDEISKFIKMLNFATYFGHFDNPSGVYKQQNLSKIFTGLCIAMDPLLTSLSYQDIT